MRNPLLRLAQAHMPTWGKRKQVEVLFRMTADALECSEPETARMGYAELLQAYAEFTSQEVLRLDEAGADLARAKTRLHDEAQTLGRKVRVVCGDDADAYRLVVLLYQNIEIDIEGSLPGELTVSRCFFSDVYNPRVCAFMSALDSGIIAGICGEGELAFSERITEGSCCCKAVFTTREGVR